jgi:hypothetical protein
MSYQPKVNDYVIWKHQVRGWVYFECDQYVTIEMLVTPRHREDVGHTPFHRNDRLLVVWKELKYVRSRESMYDKEEKCMEMVGESNRRESIQV